MLFGLENPLDGRRCREYWREGNHPDVCSCFLLPRMVARFEWEEPECLQRVALPIEFSVLEFPYLLRQAADKSSMQPVQVLGNES